MMRPFSKHNSRLDMTEVHEYVHDLERLTLLRDKCVDQAQRKRYDAVITVMQEVLQRLNEKLIPRR